MTDRQLAEFCYALAGIPASDFDQHWQQDNYKSKLRVAARTAYLRIWWSYR